MVPTFNWLSPVIESVCTPLTAPFNVAMPLLSKVKLLPAPLTPARVSVVPLKVVGAPNVNVPPYVWLPVVVTEPMFNWLAPLMESACTPLTAPFNVARPLLSKVKLLPAPFTPARISVVPLKVVGAPNVNVPPYVWLPVVVTEPMFNWLAPLMESACTPLTAPFNVARPLLSKVKLLPAPFTPANVSVVPLKVVDAPRVTVPP